MKNQVGSTRMDTALKMALIAFISLLAFSSGVYFGKNITESDYQLKALESDFSKNRHGDVAENDAEDAIAEEEVNALSEKLVNNEKSEARGVASADAHGDAHDDEDHGDAHAAPAAAGHGAPAAAAAKPATKAAAGHGAPAKADAHAAPAAKDAHGAPAAKADPHAAAPTAHGLPTKKEAATDSHGAPSKRPDLSQASKAAQRVANNAAPAEPAAAPTASRVPTSLPKTVGLSQDVEFTVQVASYPTMEAAKDHAEELTKKGFAAFPVEATVNGKVWYRVSVGSFRSQREATVYRAQLLKQTSLPSAIVQRITR